MVAVALALRPVAAQSAAVQGRLHVALGSDFRGRKELIFQRVAVALGSYLLALGSEFPSPVEQLSRQIVVVVPEVVPIVAALEHVQAGPKVPVSVFRRTLAEEVALP